MSTYFKWTLILRTGSGGFGVGREGRGDIPRQELLDSIDGMVGDAL